MSKAKICWRDMAAKNSQSSCQEQRSKMRIHLRTKSVLLLNRAVCANAAQMKIGFPIHSMGSENNASGTADGRSSWIAPMETHAQFQKVDLGRARRPQKLQDVALEDTNTVQYRVGRTGDGP